MSNRLAEPNYDMMLAWDPDALPADWQATRQRYAALNQIAADNSVTSRGGIVPAHRADWPRRRRSPGPPGAL